MTAYTVRLGGGPLSGRSWRQSFSSAPPASMTFETEAGSVTYRKTATLSTRTVQYAHVAEGGSS